MRYTLLEMTQLLLSSLDSDQVNSISDTVESDQVAKLIKSTYYDMAVDLELPEHNTIFQLNASGSVSQPCVMTLPTTVTKMDSIQYDGRDDGDTYADFYPVKYKPFDLFIQDQQALRIEGNTGYSSSSTNDVSLGTKTFVLSTSLSSSLFSVGSTVTIYKQASSTVWVRGTVTSWTSSTGTLVVSISSISGTGSSLTAWTVVPGSSSIGSMEVEHDGDTFEFIYRTNAAPTYYTTADDRQILFDSYDSSVDTTLQKSKTMCHGIRYPDFELVDSFVPDLDPTQFSLLINKSKELAFYELKHTAHPVASKEARRQRIVVQKRKQTINTGSALSKAPRYGR